MANHRVVHFEIPGEDPEALSRFYGDLFDWKIEKAPDFDYWICHTGDGDGINGAIMKKQAPEHPVTNYVNVESVDEWTKKAEELGGKVMIPKQAVSGMGWFSLVVDPQGNAFGIWQSDESAG